MKIIIEVSGGIVQSVYSSGPIPAWLQVQVVDLDGADVGEPIRADSFIIESLRHAPKEVIEAVTADEASRIETFTPSTEGAEI